MLLLIKLILILLNGAISIYFFTEKSYSLGVFFTLTILYQIYVYASIKNLGKISYFNKRVKISSIILNFFLLVILSRAVNIQIFNGDYYEKLAHDQVSSDLIKKGKRGTIYDSTGKKLAFNSYVYNIIVDPVRICNEENAMEILKIMEKRKIISGKIKLLEKEINKLASRGNRYKVIEKKIDENKKNEIEILINEKKIKNNSIFFEKIIERKYYRKKIYENLVGNIGYSPNKMGIQKYGIYGIEKTYEGYLREKILKTKDEFTKKREMRLPTSNDKFEKTLNGKNIYLTIDDEVNYILNSEVEKQFKKTKAESAYGIIMNPQNGKILGTAYFSKDKRPLRNPIFQDQFEPGSTFKPIIVASALEKKIIRKNDKFDVGNGTIRKYNHTIKESTRSTKGILTIEEIIKKSSNVGMVLISDKFSDEEFEDTLKEFGLYEKTGVDFSSELKPYAQEHKKWDKLKKNTMSFGQGIVLTPIQLITAFSAVINGGTLYRPHIVDRVEDQDGIVIRRNLAKEIRKVMAPEISDTLKEILENNVLEGSGKRAMVNGYRVGGKTGTAQIIDPKGGYIKNQYLASFIGFLPVEKPEYTVLLMFLKPQGETIYTRFGSSVGAPVFSEIVSRITRNKNMLSRNINKLSSSEVKKENKVSKIFPQAEIGEEIMPNLIGLNTREVLSIFSKTRYKIEFQGKGLVIEQYPKEGTELLDIETLIVKLGLEEEKK
ncbi:MAG: penicillin-binding transpeptidase domain-containing protein [Fusobacteriaceae bacterium]